jgi:hypothetical protein
MLTDSLKEKMGRYGGIHSSCGRMRRVPQGTWICKGFERLRLTRTSPINPGEDEEISIGEITSSFSRMKRCLKG